MTHIVMYATHRTPTHALKWFHSGWPTHSNRWSET